MTADRRDPPGALTAFSARADDVLSRTLPPDEQAPQELHRAMRYAVLGGGKRLRPVLVYATGTALGAKVESLDACAAAVEIIHAYSLVHDDLPAMDDDSLRRGRPTCHIAFGEATAILAGDALQALAFEVLARDTAQRDAPSIHVEMLATLAAACGSHGMAGGQALDLAAVGKHLTPPQLERMHVQKTGALIRASVRLGALAAGCNDANLLDALERYGHCIGLAFQIRDDILDIEGDSAVIGKTAGKDAANAKPTYPGILGIDAAQGELRQFTEAAINAVKPLGACADELISIARYVAERDS
ncbi:MAG TPA: farnesyl diphosphate synthase [Rudaea sp.]|nr:farnesyl diphosphate synthase [Rudaea sp.]